MEELEKDLKDEENEEEESSDDAGQSSEEEKDEVVESGTAEEDQKSDDDLREQLKKVTEERDNYKAGLLSAKTKKRQLVPDSKTVDADVQEKKPDLSDERIKHVLYRENEKRVLTDVIDRTSGNFIPELVDDLQYNEIVGYLPNNLDRSSEASIRRALKIAVHAWKFDRGIKDEKKESNKAAADLAATRSLSSGGNSKEQKTPANGGRKILIKETGIDSWYK